MIATGLTFLFGMLLTALVALLVAPLAWRKAQTLARREYEATIPTSANEIRAEFDKVRAEAAVSVRRGEVLVSKAREKSARTQAELGRATVENVELLKRNRNLLQLAEEREDGLTKLRIGMASRDEDHALLSQQLGAARHDADLRAEELEALGRRFQELTDIAEERKIQLVATEAKLDRMGDALRSSERATRDANAAVERLRGEASTSARTSGQERSNLASLNDRISTLLAGIADRDEEIARLKEELAAAVIAEAARQHQAEQPQPAPQRDRAAAGGTAQQRLRATLARKAGSAEVTAEETADIREKIAEIAARVIRVGSLAEGADSPIARMVAAPSDGNVRAGSLADRVRQLAEAEKAATPKAAKV